MSENRWGAREHPAVDLEKKLPGETGPIRPAVHKGLALSGMFYPSNNSPWGMFVGDNGVRVTAHQDDVRDASDAVDEFEAIIRSIDGVTRIGSPTGK